MRPCLRVPGPIPPAEASPCGTQTHRNLFCAAPTVFIASIRTTAPPLLTSCRWCRWSREVRVPPRFTLPSTDRHCLLLIFGQLGPPPRCASRAPSSRETAGSVSSWAGAAFSMRKIHGDAWRSRATESAARAASRPPDSDPGTHPRGCTGGSWPSIATVGQPGSRSPTHQRGHGPPGGDGGDENPAWGSPRPLDALRPLRHDIGYRRSPPGPAAAPWALRERRSAGFTPG